MPIQPVRFADHRPMLLGGLGRMRVPAAHYAVFHHAGHSASVGATWGAIWGEWVPGSGRTMAPTPDFERYGESFDPATGLGGFEIWVPVVEE